MCIHIAVVERDHTEEPVWDPDDVAILVQRGTHPHDLIRNLAALLIDLGAPTTTATGGLACFCGDPITIPHEAYAAGPL